jgi:hypothetical protein
MQNLGLLPTCILLGLTQFHLSECATTPGEHDTSPALKGTTYSSEAVELTVLPWMKLVAK